MFVCVSAWMVECLSLSSTWMCKFLSVSVHRWLNVCLCQCMDVQMFVCFQCMDVQMYFCVSAWMCKCLSVSVHGCANVCLCQYMDVQMFVCVSKWMCKCLSVSVHGCANVCWYPVHGCANLANVLNAVVVRTRDATSVSCTVTGETYFLTCIDLEWRGELKNCTAAGRGDLHCSFA